MKKFFNFIAALFLLIICSANVSAEKTDWSDKSYDFSKIRSVKIHDIKLTDSKEFETDLLHQILQEEYLKSASKSRNYQTINQDGNSNADVYVTAELLQWHDDFYIKPEYTSWERKEMTRTKHHRDGKKTKEIYYITVPVVHPPERVNTSTVRIRFDVYDSSTGKQIFSRDEIRVRDHSTRGEKGIFGRICKSFFEDLDKKTKH